MRVRQGRGSEEREQWEKLVGREGTEQGVMVNKCLLGSYDVPDHGLGLVTGKSALASVLQK